MRALTFVLCWAAGAAFASSPANHPSGDMTASPEGGATPSDITFAYSDPFVKCLDATSDATPCALTLKSGDAYPGAIVNTTGGALTVKGGLGTFAVTLDDYNNCSGETVTFDITVAGTTTQTVLTEGVEWTAATSDAATIGSLVSAMAAVASVTSVTTSSLTGEIGFDDDVRLVNLSESQATCTTLTESVNGALYINALSITDTGSGTSVIVSDQGGLMLALGVGYPAPDGGMLHIWDGNAGGAGCSDSTDALCVERNSSNYLRLLGAANGFIALVAGDSSDNGFSGLYFGMSNAGGNTGIARLQLAGATVLDLSSGTTEYKQAQTISTSVGNLTLNPVGIISLQGSTQISFEQDLVGLGAGAPRILVEAASLTNPVFTSNDLNTGLGFDGTNDTPVLIGGSKSLLSCDGGDTDLSCKYYGNNGMSEVCTFGQETLTFAGGGGDASKTTTNLIPAGSRDVVVTARVLTQGANCTSADYGESGGTVDLWGDDIAVAATTTVDPTDYTSNLTFNTETATDVIITGVGGNCVDMVVRVGARYCVFTAPAD